MSTLPPTSATDPLGNVSAAADHETVFYEGSPKLRGETGLLLKCLLAAAVLVAVPIIAHAIQGYAIWWLYLLFILAAIATLALPMLLVRRNKYRISNYRIDHEEGLLSKRIDTIELWHVDDVRMEQSVVDRMMGVGTITIHSNDPTSPILPLRSLPDPRRLLDAIKQRIIAVKRQRGVVKFDGSGGLGGVGGDMSH
ncbi:PH domain-containing protein [bacterium]|nr:MAG: PH domain-containing protein [bacterium]